MRQTPASSNRAAGAGRDRGDPYHSGGADGGDGELLVVGVVPGEQICRSRTRQMAAPDEQIRERRSRAEEARADTAVEVGSGVVAARDSVPSSETSSAVRWAGPWPGPVGWAGLVGGRKFIF